MIGCKTAKILKEIDLKSLDSKFDNVIIIQWLPKLATCYGPWLPYWLDGCLWRANMGVAETLVMTFFFLLIAHFFTYFAFLGLTTCSLLGKCIPFCKIVG